MDCSPPGSSVHGISQAGMLEWIAISFSRGSSWPRDQTHGFFTTEPPGKLFEKQHLLPLKKKKKHTDSIESLFCDFL